MDPEHAALGAEHCVTTPSQLAGSAGGSPKTITTAFTVNNINTGFHWIHTNLDVTTYNGSWAVSGQRSNHFTGNTNAEAFNLANQVVTTIVGPDEVSNWKLLRYIGLQQHAS